MDLDWSKHPLKRIVSDDKDMHLLYQAREGGDMHLGTVRRRGTKYYFYPVKDRYFSGTQLWQCMCYVVDLNNGGDGYE